MANTNEQIVADLFRRARMTEAERDYERYEEIEAFRILDVSAGNRAIWFDKSCPIATFVDVRAEVEPDFIADARCLPPGVGSGFGLVVFDPPHKNNAASGKMAHNYGHHTAKQITDIIRGTAKEAHRVTAPNALMAFKWNTHTRKLSSVLPMLAPYWLPLFGHGVSAQQRTSQTSWTMLLRVSGIKNGSEPRR